MGRTLDRTMGRTMEGTPAPLEGTVPRLRDSVVCPAESGWAHLPRAPFVIAHFFLAHLLVACLGRASARVGAGECAGGGQLLLSGLLAQGVSPALRRLPSRPRSAGALAAPGTFPA